MPHAFTFTGLGVRPLWEHFGDGVAVKGALKRVEPPPMLGRGLLAAYRYPSPRRIASISSTGAPAASASRARAASKSS
ncbi:hypothetical protein GCM10027187_41000 [Streptosporangium sandarakinum]